MARCDELSLVLWVSSDGCVYRTRTSKSRDQGAAPTPVERIISNLTAPFDVAVAPTIGRLFISDPGAGVIFVSDMEGGDLSVWARVDDVHGLDVVEDLGHVYWTAGSALYRAPIENASGAIMLADNFTTLLHVE